MYLSELASLPGVSGCEDAVRNFIREKVTPCCDAIEVDTMGNLMCFKKGTQGTGRTLMVCAHMDEVGLIVSRITDKGFLKFKTVGGIDPRVLISKRVLVGPSYLPGVIGRKAIHLLTAEERKKAPKVKDLYIDIGALSKEEAEEKVSIGEYVVFNSPYVSFGDGLVKSKALDDRAGCALMLSLMEQSYPEDVWFCFTVQEEVGLRGAGLCAKKIKPDVAIILEATTCSDIQGTEKNMVSTRLGGGCALSLVDGATSYNRSLVQKVYDRAQKENIPVQFKQTATGGNDAGIIHLSAGGIVTLSVSVPARYIHSPSSVISLRDYESAKKLTLSLLKEAIYV